MNYFVHNQSQLLEINLSKNSWIILMFSTILEISYKKDWNYSLINENLEKVSLFYIKKASKRTDSNEL